MWREVKIESVNMDRRSLPDESYKYICVCDLVHLGNVFRTIRVVRYHISYCVLGNATYACTRLGIVATEIVGRIFFASVFWCTNKGWYKFIII